jgi:hypothetical protein
MYNIIYNYNIYIYIYIHLFMSLQIFKTEIPDEDVVNFLDSVCIKNDKHYTMNKEIFKRGVYNEIIPNFLSFCVPFYHISKRIYLEKKLTYNSFTTILRQLCKLKNFTYTSKIHYDRSCYDIIYYIFYKD